MIQTKVATYQKHDSFRELHIAHGKTSPEEQTQRALIILDSVGEYPQQWFLVLAQVEKDLQEKMPVEATLKLTPFVADEMRILPDEELPKYLFHRYRYEVYPKLNKLDEYPPYLQIEPSSICNYRCVFCYQVNQSFSEKKSTHMGTMLLEQYKHIVDEAESNIEFLSLSSRGEPLICKEFGKMMEYSVGKFLNLKVNTNASLLTEKHCHSLLCGGARTVVFSVDAAEEPLYSQLRVNGKLEKVLKNIERFQKIRETEYKDTKIITRVSGVLVNEAQNMSGMKKMWGELVDQISFVKYNPWENVYESQLSGVNEPCSDLWRRMFVWYDGTVNPCDTDFKSRLQVGKTPKDSLSQLWRGEAYQRLREQHQNASRKNIHPCNQCVVV